MHYQNIQLDIGFVFRDLLISHVSYHNPKSNLCHVRNLLTPETCISKLSFKTMKNLIILSLFILSYKQLSAQLDLKLSPPELLFGTANISMEIAASEDFGMDGNFGYCYQMYAVI